jgi:hypothetical protein
MREYSYIGKGKVFLAKLNDEKLRYVGNCDKVELSFSEETKELKDFSQAGGGVVNSVSRIDKVEIALNLFDYSPINLAMAMYGEASTFAGGNVVGEAHMGFKDHLIRLEHSHIRHVAVSDVNSDVVYQEGKDYEVLSSGILITEKGRIADSTALIINYQYVSTDIIQALVNSGGEYHFLFDGLNEAQSGKKVVLDIYRVKFTPTSSLSFIGDDFGSLELKGIALADITKTGAGTSRYFKVEMEHLNS